jgi:uracil-DNA glycosylase family 4
VNESVVQMLRDEQNWTGDFVIMPESVSIPEKPDKSELSESGTLDDVKKSLEGCSLCRLSATRKNIVFGEGNPNARILFIGEGPGAVEDNTGRPFVGPAGQLLTDIIVKGMGLERKDVYIANIVKCRPPGNRNPLPEEVDSCIGYLKKQISLINPEVIITLGAVSTHNLLGITTPISKLRGNFTNYMGITVMPTFHPSYLLQNPSKKRETWEDIKKVMEILGLNMPLRS